MCCSKWDCKKKLKGIDITIYDAEKCFDKLWEKECLNDLYNNGLKNDNLNILHLSNSNAKVAIKTKNGLIDRFNISETIMQGTVWGCLSSTSNMDQLSKLSYRNPEELFKYKGVPIPPLEMVDNILTVTNVGKTLTTNKLVNTFIESKRLRLSDNKCAQIHIGGGHTQCPILKVHDQNMKTSIKEKYLGDKIESSGRIQATIDHRKEKANGIISEITSIVNDIPFGKYRMEVALKLRPRESMLINGILYNSKAWHGVIKKHIKELEALDEAL